MFDSILGTPIIFTIYIVIAIILFLILAGKDGIKDVLIYFKYLILASVSYAFFKLVYEQFISQFFVEAFAFEVFHFSLWQFIADMCIPTILILYYIVQSGDFTSLVSIENSYPMVCTLLYPLVRLIYEKYYKDGASTFIGSIIRFIIMYICSPLYLLYYSATNKKVAKLVLILASIMVVWYVGNFIVKVVLPAIAKLYVMLLSAGGVEGSSDDDDDEYDDYIYRDKDGNLYRKIGNEYYKK